MKKVLLILFVILVIIIGVAFGGYFVFKDEIDVLQNEIENAYKTGRMVSHVKPQSRSDDSAVPAQQTGQHCRTRLGPQSGSGLSPRRHYRTQVPHQGVGLLSGAE